MFYRSRTITTRPAVAAAGVVEAGSLSNELIGLPMPMPLAAPVDGYLLAFDHAPPATIGGFYYQQDNADDDLPATQVKSLPGFRELLTTMVERGDGAVAKAELHQDWTEATYAQQSAVSSQTWNPFLNSG